ncbi:MAG: PAS domain-containing hybrid sensor histidine kinase/response regulator [Bacteroidota bacterium]
MSKQNSKSEDDASLRQKAEDKLERKKSQIKGNVSESDMLKLIHELEVHQIELELQNEELVEAKEKAELTEEKYTSLFDFAPSAFFNLTPNGDISEINLAGAKMLGKERSKLVGARFSLFVSSNTRALFNDLFEKALKDKKPSSCEVAFVNNRSAPIYAHLSGIIAEDGQHCLITAVDITGRKQSEKDLQEKQSLLMAIYRNAPLVLMVVDSDRCIQQVNSFASQFAGRDIEEMLGLRGGEALRCLHALDDPKGCGFGDFCDQCVIRNTVLDTLETGNTHLQEESPYYFQAKDDEIMEMTFLASTTPIIVKDKRMALVTLQDMTKRKQAEQIIQKTNEEIAAQNEALNESNRKLIEAKERVEESEEKLKSILRVAPSGIGVIINRTFVEVNPKVCEMTGYRSDELLGQNARIIYPTQEDYDFVEREKYGQIEKYGTGTVETRWQRKDGKILDVLLSSTLVDSDDLQKMVIFTVLDISARIKSEHDLKAAKEKAEESDRLKSAFLANMSHEIRTPMNGILGFADLLKEPGLAGDELQQYIGIIEKSGKRMLNIINDIVDISKIEAGLMELNVRESNINTQIEYIYTLFKPEAEAKGIELSLRKSLPEKEAIINTDSEKVYAILTNLVKNALKYSKEGSIKFGYDLVQTRHASFVQFYVKDTGIGIPKDKQETIFDRFIQADVADKMAYQGAGLGLAITKAYVEMLDGKIWVESEEGKGSTFYFTLPYNTGPIAETIDRQLKPLAKDNDMRKLKVLIAEDDEVSKVLLHESVKLFAKEVLNARTGNEAIELCRNKPDIDLILMDVLMPEKDGYMATQQIREFNKEVVIVAQTAYGLTGDQEKSIEAGCNDYIAKPINKTELQAVIQKYFRE